MQFTITINAAPPLRFDPAAFAALKGQTIPLPGAAPPGSTATLVAVSVPENRDCAHLTYECDDVLAASFDPGELQAQVDRWRLAAKPDGVAILARGAPTV